MADNGEDEFEIFRREMKSSGVRKAAFPATAATQKKNRPLPIINKDRSGVRDRQATASQVTSSSQPPMIDRTSDGSTVEFARSGLQKSLFKKLKQGSILADELLDLHGFRGHEAERLLEKFLQDCLDLGYRCILIIHGKGQRSEQVGGVLKPLTIHWLKDQPEVLAFCSAQPRDGGSGATTVLLKTHSSTNSEEY